MIANLLEAYNPVDLVFGLFLTIFILSGVLRGFIRELFAMVNWLIAFLSSYAIAPHIVKLILPYYQNKLVLDISVRFAVFITIFLTFLFFTSKLSKDLQEKFPKFIDKTLGFLFGVVKTLLVFGIVYSLYLNFYDRILDIKTKERSEKLPKFFTEARTSEFITISGQFVDPAIKNFFQFVIKNYGENDLDKKIKTILEGSNSEPLEKAKEVEKMEGNLNDNEQKTDGKNLQKNPTDISAQDQGYNKNEIDKKERLMNIIDQKKF